MILASKGTSSTISSFWKATFRFLLSINFLKTYKGQGHVIEDDRLSTVIASQYFKTTFEFYVNWHCVSETRRTC